MVVEVTLATVGRAWSKVMVVPLCVPVVEFPALSVITALNTMVSPSIKLPLKASKVAASKESALLGPKSLFTMV